MTGTSLLAVVASGCVGTIRFSDEQLRLRAGSSVVIVHPKDGVAFYVPTERGHLDELIALLSYFSPEATLKSGIGF